MNVISLVVTVVDNDTSKLPSYSAIPVNQNHYYVDLPDS